MKESYLFAVLLLCLGGCASTEEHAASPQVASSVAPGDQQTATDTPSPKFADEELAKLPGLREAFEGCARAGKKPKVTTTLMGTDQKQIALKVSCT